MVQCEMKGRGNWGHEIFYGNVEVKHVCLLKIYKFMSRVNEVLNIIAGASKTFNKFNGNVVRKAHLKLAQLNHNKSGTPNNSHPTITIVNSAKPQKQKSKHQPAF